MSDIDFTIITDKKENAAKILQKKESLKKFLPNIGECEVFLKEEWKLKTQLECSPLHEQWTAIYLIRKLGWQRNSLVKASTAYDKQKIQRGIGITMRKLGHKGWPLSGDALFSFLATSPKASNPYVTSMESLFLGATFGLDPQKVDIHFQSINAFERFRLLLPDTLESPKVTTDNVLKTYFMMHELLVATISLRLVMVQGDTKRAKEITSWISDLHQRGCPTISMALK